MTFAYLRAPFTSKICVLARLWSAGASRTEDAHFVTGYDRAFYVTLSSPVRMAIRCTLRQSNLHDVIQADGELGDHQEPDGRSSSCFRLGC